MRSSARPGSRSSRIAPPIVFGQLVGRDGILARLAAWLGDLGAPPVLVLRGPAGSGKTAIALELVRQVLALPSHGEVVWLSLDRPEDGVLLAQGRLHEAVAHARQRMAAAGTALEPSAVPSLVVADGLDDLSAAAAITEAALRWVAGCRLPALDAAAALALLRQVARRRGLTDTARAEAAVLAPLIAATAGHPGAIALAAGQLRLATAATVAQLFESPDATLQAFYRRLWEPAWLRADATARRVAGTVACLTSAGAETRAEGGQVRNNADARDGAEADALDGAEADMPGCAPEGPAVDAAVLAGAAGLPGEVLADALIRLQDLGLLEPAGDAVRRSYRLPVFLAHYLRLIGAGAAAGEAKALAGEPEALAGEPEAAAGEPEAAPIAG
jgi:DNA polymerase III delta prime subunit